MRIRVTVKPNAKQQQISTAADGSLVVWLISPPVDGKANAELIKLLAKYLRNIIGCGDRRSLYAMAR